MNKKTVKIHIVTPLAPLQIIQHYLTTKIVGACLADDREVIFTSAGDTFDVVVLEFAPGSTTGIPDNDLRLDVMSMLFPLIHDNAFSTYLASKMPELEYTHKVVVKTATLPSQEEMNELRRLLRTVLNDPLAFIYFSENPDNKTYDLSVAKNYHGDEALRAQCLNALYTYLSIKQN